MQIIDLKKGITLQTYKTSFPGEFWAKRISKLESSMKIAKSIVNKLATMFGFTHVCETTFFKILFLKNK